MTGRHGGERRRLLGFWPGSTSYSGGGREGGHVDVCFGVNLTSGHGILLSPQCGGDRKGGS